MSATTGRAAIYAPAVPAIEIRLLGGFAVSVDGMTVGDGHWSRRHAAALVKILALSPGRRLHREQVLDRLWPDDTVDEAGPKLHKAAHFARRAIGVDDAVVLRDDVVALCPHADVTVDAVRFEDLARDALATRDTAKALAALGSFPGELLPDDRYEEWADDRREQLRLRELDLLRLAEQWETVLERDAGDEAAHLALMHRHARQGDRHAALRQYERMSRVLQSELGVAPGREAVALRDSLLAGATDTRAARTPMTIGRAAELAIATTALADAAAGASRTLIVSGPGGIGKTTFLGEVTAMAKALGFRTGHGVSAPVEGAWPYAPVVEGLADLCRRHPTLLDGLDDEHRAELERALSGVELSWNGGSSHQRLFVAAAELVRLAAATNGLLFTVDDVHEADDGSLQLLHYIARSTRDQRLCLIVSHRPGAFRDVLGKTLGSLVARHGAIEVDLTPLGADDVVAIVAAHVADPSPDLVSRITALSGGLPFAVNELARRAAEEPDWAQSLDATMVAGIDPVTRELLQRTAVVGTEFDTDEFVALSGRSQTDAFEHLDHALAAGIIEPSNTGYRFRHGLVRDALLEDLPPHRRRRIHHDAARRLIEQAASPARIGHHLMEAGEPGEAVAYLVRAAETEAAIGAYRDALALVDAIRPHAVGAERATALALRGDLLNALGDPQAPAAYREALNAAAPADIRSLRARLARSAVMSGDLETARAVLDGLPLDGGPDDADILLARGNIAFFESDFAAAQAAAEAAQSLVLAGEVNWKVLDLVALQGLLAHLSGNWFDRLAAELRRSRQSPEVANAIFDGYLCAAEYLLYGPTPYHEVMAVARDLRVTARRSGALRAVAFASTLIGEAALLSGDLALATAELTEASDLHRDLGSAAGEAHSLQRLAEVRLAEGDREEASALLNRSLRLARGSMVANHLMQRIFGTLITAAADPQSARAIVDRAESILGWDEVCPFCSIMLSVPASIACAECGDLEHAHRHLDAAAASAVLWQDTSWEAGLAEAQAAVARADGDAEAARQRLAFAADRFQRAGQPIDAERCLVAMAGI